MRSVVLEFLISRCRTFAASSGTIKLHLYPKNPASGSINVILEAGAVRRVPSARPRAVNFRRLEIFSMGNWLREFQLAPRHLEESSQISLCEIKILDIMVLHYEYQACLAGPVPG